MTRKRERIFEILKKARQLAIEYKKLTGKPLGITGEIAEFEAARVLGLELAKAREAGWDATEKIKDKTRRLQIKGRSYSAQNKKTQRLGRIDISKDWDAVLTVLLDENLQLLEIWETERGPIQQFIKTAQSETNQRGALTVQKVKALGRQRWPKKMKRK